MGKALSDAQILHYEQRGFVSPIDVLSADEVAHARAQLEAFEADKGAPIGPPERVKSFLLFPWVDTIMRNEGLLDAVEDLVGPDILCWNTIFWVKEAQTPSYVGWHQDLTYWGLDNAEMVTVWVALSEASEAAGCMSVIPGSHLEFLPHEETYSADNLLSRGQEIDISRHETVAMPLRAGQASFHNVKAAHGSGSNTTDDRRIGLSMHYMPTHTKQMLSDWDSAALVRGTDRFGNFEHAPRPARDFDPDCVAFHEKAAGALMRIVMEGASPPAGHA